MPRSPRTDKVGAIYHALNRGNSRHDIFLKDEDYAGFERVVAEGLERYPVDLFAYQWMKNHWHLILSPQESWRYVGVFRMGDHDAHGPLSRSLSYDGVLSCLLGPFQEFPD